MTSVRIAVSTAGIVLAAACGIAEAQTAAGWRVEGTRKAPPYRLVLPEAGEGVSYIFDCSGPDLLVTEAGVTELLDMTRKDNTRPPDTGEGRVFPEKSAYMSVGTDRSQPELTLGIATPNPVKGWDITIKLPRKDKSVQNLDRAEFMTLFTTGYTALVVLEKADKKLVSDFFKECRK